MLKEILETRKIEVELTGLECEMLVKLCGRNDITVSKLLSSFISDLVESERKTGAKGRDLAQNWFGKTLEKEEPETLLSYLLREDDVERFLYLLEDIEMAEEDIEEYETAPETAFHNAEEVAEKREELKELNGYYQEYIQKLLEIKPNADIQEEIRAVKEWATKKHNLLCKGHII